MRDNALQMSSNARLSLSQLLAVSAERYASSYFRVKIGHVSSAVLPLFRQVAKILFLIC